jgi:hypothetical protein
VRREGERQALKPRRCDQEERPWKGGGGGETVREKAGKGEAASRRRKLQTKTANCSEELSEASPPDCSLQVFPQTTSLFIALSLAR